MYELEPQTQKDLEIIMRDGYITIPDVLSPAQVAHLKETVRKINPASKQGRNNFEGYKTIRTDGMLAKSSAFDFLATHPRVVKVVERILMPTFLLQQIQAIEILPGETVQPLHTDDGYVRVPRPHAPLNAATMWALDDFTETSEWLPGHECAACFLKLSFLSVLLALLASLDGSTVVFPGSHLWPEGRLPDREKDHWIHATKPAGSVTIWIGTTWHGGGANVSDKTKEGPEGKGVPRLGITCGFF